MTRILLVPIFLVPILWVWPQRGITATFYPNTHWSNEPALVRVERQINLDFMTADSASLPQQEFSVEWSGWLRTDRDGQYTFATRSDDGSTLEIDGHLVVDDGGVHFATLTNCHHCDDPRTAPDSPALLADGWRLRVLCVLDAAGRNRPVGVPDAAIVRPQTTCRHRVSDPPRLFAMGAVLVRTRVGDCGTDCEKRARDRQRRPAPIRTAPDAGACIDHRGVTRRGRDRSAGALPPRGSAAPRSAAAESLALRRSRRCRSEVSATLFSRAGTRASSTN